MPDFTQIISVSQDTAVESGKSCILFINIEEQSWVLVDADKTVLKKVPDGLEYREISRDLKIISVTVNGYRYENGCPGIMFFPDGSCEYSEIEIQDFQKGKRYLVKLNPYIFVPEINEM
ncbi:MAG: hypothetical protein NC906_07250 [Candidatus Omnitrophica bacterium]|nr:hypothetical protein [Candidatus Omnitrophota bacterium]MCM8817453.1 hypothetical protein [Candidatus Omnitrophota bacterium]